ncbi:hypothetical protein HO173_009039 [Letharia columbiana]|uniref:Uncharacterized protein n=1 Tax=Letharia columbiana TaxID=112416 RepID=A0A8H6L2A5_9LECA|nr:uncharacterized protein HO173_009039 [Letharia columbiana]KAF6232824.1 hypothetical protein HO173_009039 [Letharia columbiana]
MAAFSNIQRDGVDMVSKYRTAVNDKRRFILLSRGRKLETRSSSRAFLHKWEVGRFVINTITHTSYQHAFLNISLAVRQSPALAATSLSLAER